MITKIFLESNYDINSVVSNINEFISRENNPVIIITGATNSGKTALAHLINQRTNTRLISADSRQIYKKVDLGSNKPVVHERSILDGYHTSITNEGFIYWNLDKLNLNADYSAQDYREDTRHMFFTLHSQKIIPLVVGGSTHWIRSLISETISPFYESDKDLYMDLCSKSLSELQNTFTSLYGDSVLNHSDWNNSRRLSRAIEYKKITGKSIYENTLKANDDNNYIIFQINIDRAIHREKIRKSVENRINSGWICEVENLIQQYSENILNKLGQGYRIIGNYILEGKKISLEDLINLITIAEMRYAKKQVL